MAKEKVIGMSNDALKAAEDTNPIDINKVDDKEDETQIPPNPPVTVDTPKESIFTKAKNKINEVLDTPTTPRERLKRAGRFLLGGAAILGAVAVGKHLGEAQFDSQIEELDDEEYYDTDYFQEAEAEFMALEVENKDDEEVKE